MEDIKKRLIHLHHCRGATWRFIKQWLDNDPSLASIYEMKSKEIQQTFQINEARAKVIYEDLNTFHTNDIVNELINDKIVPLTYFDEAYPPLLKEIYDPPWVLYCKGNISLLHSEKMLAIVGTRTPTAYSRQCLEAFIPPLVKENFTIVSGLALGVDSLAHQITIRSKGKTIGVLGSGFCHMYPSKNISLFEHMAKEHCIITEYPRHVRPQKWHFPMRNRIISGLSKGVLIVEAKEKSGSLITADQALEQGRDVFAVPGTIFSKYSIGTNQLIQQGAKLVISAEDILCEWN